MTAQFLHPPEAGLDFLDGILEGVEADEFPQKFQPVRRFRR
jgi:hypothetical protein